MTKPQSLNDLAADIHQTAVDKGWWEDGADRNLGVQIALMHSELSEALEEWRNGSGWYYSNQGPNFYSKPPKPEGIGVELADCLIRILDTMAAESVDIDQIMFAKMEYNRTRPYKHGGKRV